MRLTSSGAYARPPVPKMPAGLVELMEDLTRNVLRHNPENVYEFCAGHMEKLLEIRDRRAPKQDLTLDQKIARVQEKMNKKAVLRRQKYDMNMKHYRLNSKLEEESKQRDDQIRSSNVVEDTTSSSETNLDQVNESKQTIVPVAEESLTLHSNMAEVQSKDSIETNPNEELNQKNVEELAANNDVEENKSNESVEAELVQDIDMNIETEIKDSIEHNQEQDIEMKNKSKEPTKTNIVEIKSEVENIPIDSIEKSEQNAEKQNKLERSALLNLVEIKNDFSHSVEEEPTKSILVETGAGESVAGNLVKNDTSDLDVVDPKNSTETLCQEDTEITIIKDEYIEDPIAQNQTAFSNAVEDESKGPNPVHHEQDLVDDLEVEIFHEPSESKNGSKKESTDTQDLKKIKTEIMENETVTDKSHEEGQSSAENTNSFDQHDLPSPGKEEGEGPEIKTNIKNSEIESINYTPIFNSDNSPKPAESNENALEVESKTEILYESFSGYKSNSTVTGASVSAETTLDNEGMMTDKISPPADEKEKDEPLADIITNNFVPDEKYNMNENVQDVEDTSPSDNSVLELPMQKKEYALLLPEMRGDDETDSALLKAEMHEDIVSLEMKNIHNTTENNILNDKNNLRRIESAGSIKETDVVGTTDAKKEIAPRVDDVQGIKNIDKLQEQIKKGIDHVENKENSVGNETHHFDSHNSENNGEVKEQSNENKEQEFEKVFTENFTLNYDIKTESETAKLEKRSVDADENISSNSELTQKTETPFVNDSADESTVGDSNDSLMDHDAGTLTRFEENSKNPSTMDLETAAITIQKVFRTFLFKSRCSTFEDTSTDEANPITDDDNDKEELEYPIAKERRALGISRMDTVLQTVNEEKSLSLSTDDSSTLSSAATVIQAHIRGFLVRNKFKSHKTTSTGSLVNSDGPSTQSFEADEPQKKTVLNIHIVPDGDHFLSRDESLITSMDLSLDGTPPSSINLHPLGYDKSEPRKQLKREDAIQSISPPSNNSGKLSEDVDSVKEMVINDIADPIKVSRAADTDLDSDSSPTKSNTLETVVETIKGVEESPASSDLEIGVQVVELKSKRTLTKMSSDECDVVTPFELDRQSSIDSDRTSGLLHSGEFHDIVLPTKVTRSDTSVVRGE